MNSQSYGAYLKLLQEYAERGMTSGKDQKASYIQFTKLNFARVKRLEKQVNALIFPKIDHEYLPNIQVVAITETWCGDAAQILPYVNALTKFLKWPEMKILFRDENPELMNAHLTNGSQSIPKILFFDENENVTATWGPRPEKLQKMVMDARATANFDYVKLSEDIQRWYLEDRGVSIIDELSELVTTLSREGSLSKAARIK